MSEIASSVVKPAVQRLPVFIFAALAATSATAQQREAPALDEPSLEEVTVTAQRRKERLQDVPIAISVVSGEALDTSSAKGATEMLGRVPGISFETAVSQGGTTQLTARGVSAALGVNAGASPIGYYLDSVSFGFVRSATLPDPDVYDLSRMEVLLGPQGTLYGANAQGGVVRLLTNDADPSAGFKIKGRVSASSTEGGGAGYRGDVAMNVPLIDDKLALRAVVGVKELGGWIDKPDKKDANDQSGKNGRIKLSGRAGERVTYGLGAWFSRADAGATDNGDVNDRDFVTDIEQGSSDFDLYSANLGVEFDSFTFSSATGYIEFKNTDFNGAARFYTDMSANTFTHEFTFASKGTGPWRWTAGAMYRDSSDTRFQVSGDRVYVPGTNVAQRFSFTSKSWAAFGEITRSFLDGRTELTLGARRFEDQVSVQEFLRAGPVQPASYISRTDDFSKTTPRVTFAWRPRDRGLMTYASYSEGFRSGVQQLPAIVVAAPAFPPIKADLLRNYEVGAKGNLLDGKVAFNVAAYYLDWKNVQLPLTVFILNLPRGALVNGAAASGPGVDIGLDVRPVPGVTFGVNASWNDLNVDEDVLIPGTSTIVFHKGARLNASPELLLGGYADYEFALGGSGLTAQLGASVNYSSVRSSTLTAGPVVTFAESDPMCLARATFAIRPASERWRTTLFIDNLTGEDRVPTRAGNRFVGDTGGGRVRPRTIGLQFEFFN